MTSWGACVPTETARTRDSAAVELQTKLDLRTRELKEALERQAATADILRIISSAPTDTQPVFEAIVGSGLKLFPQALISIALSDGREVALAAIAEPDAARAEAWRQRFPFPLTRDYMHGIAILDARTVDIPDVADVPVDVGTGAQNFLASGHRAITIMPMMRGEAAIGTLSVVRLAAGPLSDEQLALLKTFASQAASPSRTRGCSMNCAPGQRNWKSPMRWSRSRLVNLKNNRRNCAN